ncbi:hypothetical protein ACFQ9X_54090 [Catenulispora yoronensis]
MRGAHGGPAPPDRGVVQVPADQRHLGAARQPGPGGGGRLVGADQDQRGGVPAPPGGPGVRDHLDPDPGLGRHPGQGPDQRRVRGHGQRRDAAGSRTGIGIAVRITAV